MGRLWWRRWYRRVDTRWARAAISPFVLEPADGTGCIGCHIAVSPDGKRIAGAGKATATGGIVGMILRRENRKLQ